MNKVISTKERCFMTLVGPSGCGKTQLILEMLVGNVFIPKFDQIFYFYQNIQPVFQEMFEKVENIEFMQGADFDFIDTLPADGTNYLLIFDDLLEEISKKTEFTKLATAGRHKKLNVIYIKHNLYHQSSRGRDAELQNTHIALFKSPRDVQQIERLGAQLGLGKQLTEWYKDATKKPYGHLMIDLLPNTLDILRYSTGLNPTKFYLPHSKARKTIIEDGFTNDLYARALLEISN